MVFLTMAEVARTPICVKDTVSYETEEWKSLKRFSYRGGGTRGARGAIAPPNISVGKQRSLYFSQALFCIYMQNSQGIIYA